MVLAVPILPPLAAVAEPVRVDPTMSVAAPVDATLLEYAPASANRGRDGNYLPPQRPHLLSWVSSFRR